METLSLQKMDDQRPSGARESKYIACEYIFILILCRKIKREKTKIRNTKLGSETVHHRGQATLGGGVQRKISGMLTS